MNLEGWKYRVDHVADSYFAYDVHVWRKRVKKESVYAYQFKSLAADSWVVTSTPRWPLRLCLLVRDELHYRGLLP